MYTFDNYELGRTDEVVTISEREQNRLATVKMAQQCDKSIEIISGALDPQIYDTPDFVDAVKKLVLENRRARVRILVFEPKAIVQQGHRLVNLGMNLSSYVEFRTPSDDYKDYSDSLFLADTTGYIHRLNDDRFDATLNFNDKRISKHLLQKFDEIWSKGSNDTNLRRLNI